MRAPAHRDRVSKTVLRTLEAPGLRGITNANFRRFLHDRRTNERQLLENNYQLGVKIMATSYKASLDDKLLELLQSFK